MQPPEGLREDTLAAIAWALNRLGYESDDTTSDEERTTHAKHRAVFQGLARSLEVFTESGWVVDRSIKHEPCTRSKARHEYNPIERALAEEWVKENRERSILQLLFTQDVQLSSVWWVPERVRCITARDAEIVATVIQWLGSNVGTCFLQRAWHHAGWELTEKKREESGGIEPIGARLKPLPEATGCPAITPGDGPHPDQIGSEFPISSPTGDAGASSGAELSRCGAELPLLGSNQDSSDPESPVNHRGSAPPAPGNPAGEPVEPSGSSPLRHPPASASFARPMGVTMGVDRHLGRVWVVG